jgi:hypothetical protein
MARYFEVRIDEANENHVTRHGVSVREITQVFRNDPAIRRNRRARTGDYVALGITDGGRRDRGDLQLRRRERRSTDRRMGA